MSEDELIELSSEFVKLTAQKIQKAVGEDQWTQLSPEARTIAVSLSLFNGHNAEIVCEVSDRLRQSDLAGAVDLIQNQKSDEELAAVFQRQADILRDSKNMDRYLDEFNSNAQVETAAESSPLQPQVQPSSERQDVVDLNDSRQIYAEDEVKADKFKYQVLPSTTRPGVETLREEEEEKQQHRGGVSKNTGGNWAPDGEDAIVTVLTKGQSATYNKPVDYAVTGKQHETVQIENPDDFEECSDEEEEVKEGVLYRIANSDLVRNIGAGILGVAQTFVAGFGFMPIYDEAQRNPEEVGAMKEMQEQQQ